MQGPMASAAVSNEGALRMRPTPCGCTSALLSGFTGTASFAATPQLCLRRPTFSVAPEKVGKKRRWKRIGLYRGATERARRRTLRPAHGNLPTNLYYSAACVVTTLPSMIVATQKNDKTHCHAIQNTSTYSPVVQNRNKPSIPEMSRSEIDAVCLQRRVVHSPEV